MIFKKFLSKFLNIKFDYYSSKKKRIEKFLKNKFPNQNISFEGEGCFSIAYNVGKNVLRFPKMINLSGYKKEEYILNYLQNKIAFEIPKPKFYDGKLPYITYKKLLGEKWNIDDYNKLSEKGKNLFCEDVAKFFYEIHSVDLDKLDKNCIQKQDILTIDDFVNLLRYDFTNNEIDKLYNYYLKVKNNGNDFVLVHKDFSISNILIDKNYRLKAVFDFGNTEINERSFEFARSGFYAYPDIFNRIANIYSSLTNVQIDRNRINELNTIHSFYVLQLLSDNKNLKNSLIEKWNFNIKTIRKLFNDYLSVRNNNYQNNLSLKLLQSYK